MDYKNLEYFKKLQDLTGQQAWWYLYLQEFNHQLEYKPEKTNGQANALSWREDHGEGTENPENKDITFFLENLIAKSKEHVVNWLTLQSELINSIMKALKKYDQNNYTTKKGGL